MSTPADDAGDVPKGASFTTGWQSFEKMSRRQAIDTCYALESMRDRAIKRTDEARAEVDSLRAEVERLQTLGGDVQNARGDAETRAAEAKHAAESLSKAVADLAADLEKNRRGARSNGYSGAYNDGHHDARVEVGHRIRAILAADPVSLADVRELCPHCSGHGQVMVDDIGRIDCRNCCGSGTVTSNG